MVLVVESDIDWEVNGDRIVAHVSSDNQTYRLPFIGEFVIVSGLKFRIYKIHFERGMVSYHGRVYSEPCMECGDPDAHPVFNDGEALCIMCEHEFFDESGE